MPEPIAPPMMPVARPHAILGTLGLIFSALGLSALGVLALAKPG